MSFLEQYQGVLGIVGGLIALAVAVATYFRGVIQQNKNIETFKEEMLKRVHDMELKQLTTDTRFNVFWQVIEKELPKVLLRTHTPEIDKYLRKMQAGQQLTDEEREDMKNKMRAILDKTIDLPDEDSGLKLGYALLIARFESEEAVERKRQMEEDRDRGIYRR